MRPVRDAEGAETGMYEIRDARRIAQGRRTDRLALADSREVAQIAFKPDRTRHAKAPPFKRNDAMLYILPIGVIVFAGTGIQDNVADKERKLGIPLYDFRRRLISG